MAHVNLENVVSLIGEGLHMRMPLQTRNDSRAIQTKRASTTMGKHRFADNRPATVAQRELVDNSPRVLQQQKLKDIIQNSPQTGAQRVLQQHVSESTRIANSQHQQARAEKSPVVQAMFKDNGVQYTQNAEYGIVDGDPKQLLVSPTAVDIVPPTHFRQIGSTEKEFVPPEVAALENEGGRDGPPMKVEFKVFESIFDFSETRPNDCGMYAQALTLEYPDWEAEKRPGQHREGTKLVEQYDPGNSKTADNLSLLPGNSYRIDWDDPRLKPLEKCAHHVATVVAKDGVDHVTSEADAGRKITKPVFEMYGTNKNTFWQRHKDYFTLHPLSASPKLPYVSKSEKS